MDEIDVTRKLRPPRAPEESAPPPAPPPDDLPDDLPDEAAQTVALPPGAHPVPPPVVTARPAAVPSPAAQAKPVANPPPPAPVQPAVSPSYDDAHTVRFVAANAPAAGPDQGPTLDPVTGWLVVMKGPGLGRSLPLGYGIHSVGRAEDQRVCVRFGDKKISRRRHVEVSYDGKGRAFYITPGWGSTFAYLNGQPVLQPSPLRAGDRIMLGDTELAFVPFCGEAFDWQQE